MSETTYLYLGRRDKKGIKVITKIFTTKKVSGRVENIEDLNLPNVISNNIKNIAFKNRMDWELFIKSSKNYNELRKELKNEEGYSNIPISFLPSVSELTKEQEVSNKNIKKKIMIQKKIS